MFHAVSAHETVHENPMTFPTPIARCWSWTSPVILMPCGNVCPFYCQSCHICCECSGDQQILAQKRCGGIGGMAVQLEIAAVFTDFMVTKVYLLVNDGSCRPFVTFWCCVCSQLLFLSNCQVICWVIWGFIATSSSSSTIIVAYNVTHTHTHTHI